jgi:hypothetical protein
VRLDTPVAVDGEAVTMYLDLVTIDKDVTLDQGQVNVESFRITGESRRQFGRRNARQTALRYRLIASKLASACHLYVPVVHLAVQRRLPPNRMLGERVGTALSMSAAA